MKIKYEGDATIITERNFIIGSDYRSFLYTFSFIVIITIIYTGNIGFVFYFTIDHHLFILFMFISLFLGFIHLVIFLKISTMDPGIILPKWNEEDESYLNEDYFPSKIETVFIRKKEKKIKFCYSCGFYRPPKTVHCSICNHCVTRWDVS